MFAALSEGVQAAGIAAIATIITAVPAFIAAKNARAANRAVNHRKPDEPKMIDLVVETHERLATLETAFLHHLVYDHKRRDRGVEV